MATNKVYTVCGTSKHEGEFKVRFANDPLRVKVLNKHGHEDITLIELPNEMTKLEAVKFIKDLDEFKGKNEQAAIADYLDRKDEKPAKAKAVKAPKAANKDKPKPAPKKAAKPAPKKAKAKVETKVEAPTAVAAPEVTSSVESTTDEDAPF